MAESNANNSNILDFQDPGKVDNELLDMPGFVNKLKNHTLAVSPRPNPVIAFGGALAMQAFLSGSHYRDLRGLHTNLYLAALAPTGMGKEEPRTTNKRLAAEIGALSCLPDAVATGEGLEDAIARTPTMLLQCDEADSLLTSMRGSDSRASKLSEMVLRLHGETKSGHVLRMKANQTALTIVPNPHLSLFATGIPKFVYQAISPKALENGLLGRCLFLETDEFCPLGEGIDQPLPADCIAAAKGMFAAELAYRESEAKTPVVIGETPEATAKIKSLRAMTDEVTKRLFESDMPTAAALYCRLMEKALKIAAQYAISADWEHPVMTLEAVTFGYRLAGFITKKMLYEAQFYVAEGNFDRLKKRALGLMAKHGGSIDRSTLLRGLSVDASTLRRLILTLCMSDQIDTEVVSNGKVVYSLRNVA